MRFDFVFNTLYVFFVMKNIVLWNRKLWTHIGNECIKFWNKMSYFSSDFTASCPFFRYISSESFESARAFFRHHHIVRERWRFFSSCVLSAAWLLSRVSNQSAISSPRFSSEYFKNSCAFSDCLLRGLLLHALRVLSRCHAVLKGFPPEAFQFSLRICFSVTIARKYLPPLQKFLVCPRLFEDTMLSILPCPIIE